MLWGYHLVNLFVGIQYVFLVASNGMCIYSFPCHLFSLWVAVNGGRCLLINFLSIPQNVSNLSGWHVNSLNIDDTGEDRAIDNGMLLALLLYLFAQYLI